MAEKVDSSKIATEKKKNLTEFVFTILESPPVVSGSPVPELALFTPMSREPSETKAKTDQEAVFTNLESPPVVSGSPVPELALLPPISREPSETKAKTDQEAVFTNLESPPVVSGSPVPELALLPPISRESSETKAKTDQEADFTKLESSPVCEPGLLSRGCKCPVNRCSKKYCACLKANMFCSIRCECSNCQNVLQPPLSFSRPKLPYRKKESTLAPDAAELCSSLVAAAQSATTNAGINMCTKLESGTQNREEADFTKLESSPVYEPGLLSRGCKCPVNRCLKKYCACLKANMFCSIRCECSNCQNVLQPPLSFSRPKLPYRKKESTLAPDAAELCSSLVAAAQSATTNAGINMCTKLESGTQNGEEADFTKLESSPVYEPGLLSRGCKCPVNRCSKKYCACLKANMFCSIRCECSNCQNVLQPSLSFSRPKLPYRKKESTLAPDAAELCSSLVAAAQSATANAGINMCTELESGTQNGEEDSNSKTEETSVPETDTYMHQERAVLETFGDDLEKLSKSMK